MTRPRFPGFLLPLVLAFLACNGTPTEPESVFPNGNITGTVVLVESGAPAAGARVVAAIILGSSLIETVADAQGHYALSVPPGQYGIRVYAPGATTLAFSELLDVFPNSTNTLNFAISSNGCATMSGRVLDFDTKAPIGGATIRFFGQSTVSAADGSYQLQLGCPPRPAPGTFSDTMVLDHPAYQHREVLIGIPTASTTLDLFMMAR